MRANVSSPCTVIAFAALLIPGSLAAQQDTSTNFNHFRLSLRAGFNITARFQNLGAVALSPNRTTPDGYKYNYNNGYVLPDASGNAGGKTWNWGYDSPSQISGNTILLSRTGPGPTAASPEGVEDGDVNWGWEISYDREFGVIGSFHYGLEAAINYTRVQFNDQGTYLGPARKTTDAYPFTPGTTPPSTPPSYQGTFNGPGFLLGSTPVSSTATAIPGGAVISGQRSLQSDIWGLRLGPYAEYPVSQRLNVSASAGLAAACLVDSASWNETVFISGTEAATSIGSGHDNSLAVGFYVSADIAWQLSKRWSAEAGVQFQDLGTCFDQIGSREVAFDLSKSIYFTVSVGFRF